MGKVEDYEIGKFKLQIYSRLPYRSECVLEELIFKIRENITGDPSNLKGFDISKKMAINNFLLINAVTYPKLTEADLNDGDHELNEYFREIGDYLSEKYMLQYSKKMLEKKKDTKLPT
ncbi:hypothetical protein LCGC14_1229850 [marine sediment metagenome]|uniref:Uncharacterized protein n=1 Tax=marine sediment metagenome TaxID=412755 RepID=A0A0F9L8V5_9ZZZZ